MKGIYNFIRVAAIAAAVLWAGSASARISYRCYEAEVTLGLAGGKIAATFYYLAGADMENFMDELKIKWGKGEASSDLRCNGTPSNRRCRLGEDSGTVQISVDYSNARFAARGEYIFLTKDDGGEYHLQVIGSASDQHLNFNAIDREDCDAAFPEAARGGREITVPKPMNYSSPLDRIIRFPALLFPILQR